MAARSLPASRSPSPSCPRARSTGTSPGEPNGEFEFKGYKRSSLMREAAHGADWYEVRVNPLLNKEKNLLGVSVV
ncbi:hypothetical protein [Amycolatopsis sp. NPDC051903]|uniref:hypothetical protein n=1 Tax=Amycolatopsis sp. NPDC051903 TaxID=3363936 RepID=UPI0037BD0D52